MTDGSRIYHATLCKLTLSANDSTINQVIPVHRTRLDKMAFHTTLSTFRQKPYLFLRRRQIDTHQSVTNLKAQSKDRYVVIGDGVLRTSTVHHDPSLIAQEETTDIGKSPTQPLQHGDAVISRPEVMPYHEALFSPEGLVSNSRATTLP